MVTSSMHKPGWRSRRRSRLSLVERAVPRLGHHPEPDDDYDFADPDERPIGKSSASGGRADASAGAEPRAGISERSANPAETAETGSPAGWPDGAAAVDGGPQPADLSENPDPTSEAIVEGGGGEPAERASVAALAAADAGAELETPSYLRTPPTGPVLEFDWDRLIESGFIDPRDRSRALPDNMNEIIRALIRQALSDQSSWRDRVILVTSPTEHASRTAAAINFAFGLTTMGNHQAVLVDVVTDGPGAVERLGGGNRLGVSAALADESIAVADITIPTDLDRLTLVASGLPDEETLDRFASRRMLQILRYLTRNPETILIIDAPPVLVSQEAAVLSVVAGQVVMSVEAGRTTADQIDHALQRIGERHNVSLVLNESSGLADDGEPLTKGTDELLSSNRRAPGGKRRLPRATAATTAALIVGLLGAQPSDGAPPVSLSLEHAAASMPSAAPPQRWSSETGDDRMSCFKDCR